MAADREEMIRSTRFRVPLCRNVLGEEMLCENRFLCQEESMHCALKTVGIFLGDDEKIGCIFNNNPGAFNPSMRSNIQLLLRSSATLPPRADELTCSIRLPTSDEVMLPRAAILSG